MKAFIVSYDADEKRDYPSLYTVLKGCSMALRCTESTWIVATDNIQDLFDDLRQFLTEGGRLLVVELGTGADRRTLNLIDDPTTSPT